MEKVSFYAAKEYDFSLLKEIIQKIIDDHGGYEKLFEKGKKVVIKPNLVMKKKPEAAATTHPAVLDALLSLITPLTKDITIAECSGGPNTEVLMKGIYRETGIEEVCKKHKVPIHYEMTPLTLTVPNPSVTQTVEVLDVFPKADVFINLAKMKTHSLTTVTGAAKNLYGTVPGLRKVEFHARFPYAEEFAGLICDINKALPTTLNILDGIWGMEKDGPTGGVPKFAGGILGGKNPFAVDEAMCRFMGISSALSPILKRAKEEGIFDGEITLLGDNMDENLPTPFELPNSQKKSILRDLPNLFGGRLAHFLAPRPKIILKKCVGCGECARLCPKKTIVIKNKKARIKNKECIRCWCCQELCPKKAVETHSHFFLKFI